MFRLCFVWVYIIVGDCPFVKLAWGGRLCKRTNVRLWEMFSLLPEVVLYKGKQNGLLRVLLSYNFLRQCAVLSFLLVKGLERLTNFSSRRAKLQNGFGDRSILWYNFLGTTLLQLHIRMYNPYGERTL